MRFVLDLWPDLPDDATPEELLRHAVESITANPQLVWDIRDDRTDELLHPNVSLEMISQHCEACGHPLDDDGRALDDPERDTADLCLLNEPTPDTFGPHAPVLEKS